LFYDLLTEKGNSCAAVIRRLDNIPVQYTHWVGHQHNLRSGTISVLALILILMFPLRAHAQGTDAESVLKAREAALARHDLATILNSFAEDAIVVTSSGRLLVGGEQIRVWVQDQVERQQREEAGPRQLHGNKLVWPGKVYRDDWQKLGVSPLEVTQDAIVERGKIRFFSTIFTPESWMRLEAARTKK